MSDFKSKLDVTKDRADHRTTYARAVLGYDEAHETELMKAITEVIVTTSMVSDANVAAIRTGECTEALLTILASILAMSPSVTRSPTAIRNTIDEIGKRLRRKIAAAEASEDLQDFLRRGCFRSSDTEGSA
jgi:hypothetical protein